MLGLLAIGCLSACQTGPLMTPGDDCNGCHRAGGSARAFTVSGTVFSRADAVFSAGLDATDVVITDADGRQLDLPSNAAGNFYTDAPLRFPIAAEVWRGNSVRHMEPRVETGACSSCHEELPKNGAEGRVFIDAHEPPSPTPRPTVVP